MFGLLRIKAHEKGLLFRHGDFVRLLEPGRYRFPSRMWSRQCARVEIVDTLSLRFEHRLLDVMLANRSLADALTIVELADHERGLLWKNGRLDCFLAAGRHAFWSAPYKLAVEIFDLRDLPFKHLRMEALLQHRDASRFLNAVDVNDHDDVLLFADGAFVEKLAAGRHVFWKGASRVEWKSVDRREQVADVAGQEIMTADKVTLRVNLLVTFAVVDALAALTTVSDHVQALYREAQLALRAAIGTRTLDALLADKVAVGGEVKNAITGRAHKFGVTVRSVGLRDIILPGEMKMILNQVIEAEKAAQANLIRRREETAAARSQANTARLLVDNPTLARMRELELLRDMLAGAKLSVALGERDLISQLRDLAGDESGRA